MPGRAPPWRLLAIRFATFRNQTPRAGADVHKAVPPLPGLAQREGDIFKDEPGNTPGWVGVEEDAILGFARNVFKTDVSNITPLSFMGAGESGDIDRLTGTPEDRRETVSGYPDVAKNDILNCSRIAELYGESAVAPFDHAIPDNDPAEVAVRFRADFESRGDAL